MLDISPVTMPVVMDFDKVVTDHQLQQKVKICLGGTRPADQYTTHQQNPVLLSCSVLRWRWYDGGGWDRIYSRNNANNIVGLGLDWATCYKWYHYCLVSVHITQVVDTSDLQPFQSQTSRTQKTSDHLHLLRILIYIYNWFINNLLWEWDSDLNWN